MESAPSFHSSPFGHRPSRTPNPSGGEIMAETGNAGDEANVMISDRWGYPLISACLGLFRS